MKFNLYAMSEHRSYFRNVDEANSQVVLEVLVQNCRHPNSRLHTETGCPSRTGR